MFLWKYRWTLRCVCFRKIQLKLDKFWKRSRKKEHLFLCQIEKKRNAFSFCKKTPEFREITDIYTPILMSVTQRLKRFLAICQICKHLMQITANFNFLHSSSFNAARNLGGLPQQRRAGERAELFPTLVLGCIDTKFCNQILIFQHFSRSTRFAHFCTAPISTI